MLRWNRCDWLWNQWLNKVIQDAIVSKDISEQTVGLKMKGEESFDTIIIGGGSAGCVLARRLSEDPSRKVLVLEAGPPDYKLDFRIQMPAALTYPLASKMYNWWYDSEPEPALNGRQVYQPRGKGLGGSSTVNGMIWIRGN